MGRRSDSWSLYILECADGRLYAGIAKNPRARFELHRSGKGARFTRANGAKALLAVKRYNSQSTATRAEIELKKLTPAEKREWVAAHPLKPAKKAARV